MQPTITQLEIVRSQSDNNSDNPNANGPNQPKKEPLDDQLERTVTMESVQRIGKSKKLSHWDIFAADRTHLRETLSCKYILEWIVGAFCGMLSLFLVEYCFLKILNIHFCKVPNNTDWSVWKLEFLSPQSISFAFQQLIGFGFCYVFFWVYHAADIVEIKKEKQLLWTSAMYGCGLLLLFCVNLFIVPIEFDLISYVTPFSLISVVIWAYIGNGIEGVRRISVFTITVILFTVVNYMFGRFVFSNLSATIFAIFYPFYINIFETFILKFVAMFDIPRMCDSKLNEDNVNHHLGAVYYWLDRDVYVLCSAINIFTETYRIASLIYLKDDYILLIITFILSIISEIFTRNNLYYEVLYRIIYRTSAPPLNRVYSIYLSCKYHTEYIPIFIIILFNLLNFGHTADCYLNRIQSNMNISNKYWFISILFLLQIICDISGHMSFKFFVKKLKLFEKTDEARRIKYVKLNWIDIILASISLTWFSNQAFQLDHDARQLS